MPDRRGREGSLMSRGVIYVVWGERIEPVLQRSIASLRATHPELPTHVVRLANDVDPITGMLEKARMMNYTPYEETLFLDADTVVLDRLDYGFEQASRHGLACCICECPWARRYNGLPRNDAVEYNSGVLFFTRAAQSLFDRWQALAPQIDSSQPGQKYVAQDQASFAKAVEDWGKPPFVLPLNWNLRPEWHFSFFGPVKIWHDPADPPPLLQQLNIYYRQPNSVIKFHTLRAR
jgi:hypothetical protein